jgi:DNA adenine methylase
MRVSSQSPVRPLLKWAGGKRQLLPVLAEHYPPRFTRYIEPFVGSGAVFFDLLNRGQLAGRKIQLCDVNPDLIGCYWMVRDRTGDVIRALRGLAREYRSDGYAAYYDVRDRRFNPQRAELRSRSPHSIEIASRYTPELAAMLIFLNRTGFNGLFRLNRGGGFNVPVGRYTNPRICDEENIHAVADALSGASVAIDLRPFNDTLADAGRGDFVYCDPPYAPLSRTSSFANYTAEGFSAFDQRRLQQAVIAACRRGARVVVSNSSASEIVSGYTSPAALSVKLKMVSVPARRSINSRAALRGPVPELIIHNVPARARGLQDVQPRMLHARLKKRSTKKTA